MGYYVAYEDHMKIQHALADSLRILVRLRDEAHQGKTSTEVQRWARIFDNSLTYFVDTIPKLEDEYFTDAALKNVITAMNQVQSGLVSWLVVPRP